MTDLVYALGGHLLLAPLWLLLVVVIGQSIPISQDASLTSAIGGWIVIAAPSLLWFVSGGMLIRWWSQGRGPLWTYPWVWVLMVYLNVIALVALLFPGVRRGLVPPPAMQSR